MDASKHKFKEKRRQFISKPLPAGMLTCLYYPKMLAVITVGFISVELDLIILIL
jgi:hypothetical protein